MYNRNTLIYQVAHLYYIEELTQTEISKKLNISRPTISNLLKKAKESKIIEIKINYPNNQILKKQNLLTELFPDTQIFVTESGTSDLDTKKLVGKTCAEYISTQLKYVNSIGIGWGSTLHEVVEAIEVSNGKDIDIFPLIGGVGTNQLQLHSNQLTFQLAQKLNSTHYYLYAPAVTDNETSKNYFMKNNMISDLLSDARNVDLAIVGIGNPSKNSNYSKMKILSSDDLLYIDKNNIIGDILTTFYSSNGEVGAQNISDKMIGVSFDDLLVKSTKKIGVATGTQKTQIIQIVLEKQLFNTLFIDDSLADSLINLYESSEDNNMPNIGD